MLLSPQLRTLCPDVFRLQSLCYWAPKSTANVCSSFTSSVFTIGTKVCYHCEWSTKVCSDSPPYYSQFFFHRPHIGHQSLSPTIGFGSIPVLNELHLVSSGSKSYLISGGDSSYSWVFIHALDGRSS